MTNETLASLPAFVCAKVRDVLCAYDKAHVVFQNEQYEVSPSTCITATYPKDFRFVGTFKASDVFSADEMIINYVTEFRDFPSNYKGTRDYRTLNGAWSSAKIEDGNIMFA